jgi:anti-sigma B factor antagonist
MSQSEAPAPFEVDERANGVIEVVGELDLASAQRLAAVLNRQIDAGRQEVVLDLSKLRFCDSSGLTVFVQAHRNLQRAGGRLVLHNASAHLRALLTTTALDQELEIT